MPDRRPRWLPALALLAAPPCTGADGRPEPWPPAARTPAPLAHDSLNPGPGDYTYAGRRRATPAPTEAR